MKKWKEMLDQPWAANLLAVCGGVVLYMLLKNFGAVSSWFGSITKMLQPAIIGLVLAYLVDPIACFFERKVFYKLQDSNRRSLSVLVALVLLAVLIAGIISLLIPSLADSFSKVIAIANKDNIEKLMDRLNELGLNINIDLSLITEYIEKGIDYAIDFVKGNASSILNVTMNIGNVIFNGLIGCIIGLYFLLGKSSLISGLNEFRLAAFREKKYESHNEFFRKCHEILISFIGCDLLDALIVGVVNAVAMLVLKMPFVPLISVVVGVTNLLPSFGPVIGAVIGAFILLLAKPIYAVWFLIVTLVLQTVDGYVIKPKMFGNSLGVPGVVSLIAVMVGGKLAGALGILAAVPAAAIIMFIYKDHFLPWLRQRKTS